MKGLYQRVMKGVYPKILDDKKYGDEARKLYEDGRSMLDNIISSRHLSAKAVIGIYPAYAKDETVYLENMKFHFPRQLIDKGINNSNYSLADFIAPSNDYLGIFAVTTGYGVEELVTEYKKQNDDYNAIMVKIIADRLAEAFGEQLHEKVRRKFWGYAYDEVLTTEELIKEKYRGIRPAPGYPACPDHSEKDKIWEILSVKENIGIKLTETRAMVPAASVCGWYFSHPRSKYFSVGDQYTNTTNKKNLEDKRQLLSQN